MRARTARHRRPPAVARFDVAALELPCVFGATTQVLREAVADQEPAMSIKDIADALRVIVETAITVDADIAPPAGAL